MAAFICKPDSWTGFGDTTMFVVEDDGYVYTYEAWKTFIKGSPCMRIRFDTMTVETTDRIFNNTMARIERNSSGVYEVIPVGKRNPILYIDGKDFYNAEDYYRFFRNRTAYSDTNIFEKHEENEREKERFKLKDTAAAVGGMAAGSNNSSGSEDGCLGFWLELLYYGFVILCFVFSIYYFIAECLLNPGEYANILAFLSIAGACSYISTLLLTIDEEDNCKSLKERFLAFGGMFVYCWLFITIILYIIGLIGIIQSTYKERITIIILWIFFGYFISAGISVPCSILPAAFSYFTYKVTKKRGWCNKKIESYAKIVGCILIAILAFTVGLAIAV